MTPSDDLSAYGRRPEHAEQLRRMADDGRKNAAPEMSVAENMARLVEIGAMPRWGYGVARMPLDRLGRRWQAAMIDHLTGHIEFGRRSWTHRGATWWAQTTARVWSRPGSRRR